MSKEMSKCPCGGNLSYTVETDSSITKPINDKGEIANELTYGVHWETEREWITCDNCDKEYHADAWRCGGFVEREAYND